MNKMKNKKYYTVGTVLKYYTVGTVLKYYTVGTVLKYYTVGTVPKYYTVGTVPKSNRKILERGKIDTPNTHKYDRSQSCLGTGTAINSGGVKLVVLAHISPIISDMMKSCKCFKL
jgi:hypothetical protein